jgi:hypothetical protein
MVWVVVESVEYTNDDGGTRQRKEPEFCLRERDCLEMNARRDGRIDGRSPMIETDPKLDCAFVLCFLSATRFYVFCCCFLALVIYVVFRGRERWWKLRKLRGSRRDYEGGRE